MRRVIHRPSHRGRRGDLGCRPQSADAAAAGAFEPPELDSEELEEPESEDDELDAAAGAGEPVVVELDEPRLSVR